MKRGEQINLIRAKCIEANPERWNDFENLKRDDDKIRLADVLLATEKKAPAKHVPEGNGLIIFSDGSMSWNGKPSSVVWYLRNDDLTEQSDECIEFISSLLKA
jgi:hypothetical protein